MKPRKQVAQASGASRNRTQLRPSLLPLPCNTTEGSRCIVAAAAAAVIVEKQSTMSDTVAGRIILLSPKDFHILISGN